MATTMPSGAKKIDSTDNWRDIFDCHNDTCDAVDALNTAVNKIATAHNFGQYTSLDTFKSNLLSFMQSVPSFESRCIQFVFTQAVTPFHAWSTFTGYAHCIQNGSTSLYFECNVASNNGENVIIGYSNGTWNIEELALNSNLIKFTDKTTTPGSAGEVAISTVTSGLVTADNLINVVVLDLNNATADIYTYSNTPYVRVYDKNDYSVPITTSVRLRIWYKP